MEVVLAGENEKKEPKRLSVIKCEGGETAEIHDSGQLFPEAFTCQHGLLRKLF